MIIDAYSVAMRGRDTPNGLEQQLEINPSRIGNSITTVQKDTLVLEKRLTMDERQTESAREEKRREEKRREEKRRNMLE